MTSKPATALAFVLAATAALQVSEASARSLPFLQGEVMCTAYDGDSDDLLTGGLGAAGLGLAGVAPALSDPPTAAEVRRLAIFNNYRALVPIDPGGGYGTLFGPGIGADGLPTGTDGKIAGRECLAYAGRRLGRENVTMMVQVPESFDPANPCIVTAPSSGSRGVYGAIGTAGEWGLRNGCAVAYTDKGTGNGAHNLEADTVNLIRGEREDADTAGRDAAFRARLSDRARLRFNADTPDRVAYKHAHSQRNPEADWGLNVLQSIEFAFYVLNDFCPVRPGGYYDDDDDDDGGRFGHRGGRCTPQFTPGNTVVIASSVSNGGGSSVLAAEQDRRGWIDGVAASEPNVNPRPGGDFGIQQGAGEVLFDHSRSLYDYTTDSCISIRAAPTWIRRTPGPAPTSSAPAVPSPPWAPRAVPRSPRGACWPAARSQRHRPRKPRRSSTPLRRPAGTEPGPALATGDFFIPQAIAITYAKAYSRASR